MSGLSEAELHVQAMRLVCEALQDREQDGLEVDWDVIRQMHDQMDAMLQDLGHKHRYDSSEIVDLRKERDAALASLTRERLDAEERGREIERLQAFVGRVRAARDEHNGVARDAIVEAALAILDAGTEPTPVAERCPECDGSGMVDSGGFGPDGKGINVPCGGDCRGNPCPSQPTPVAEPLDAEGGA